MSRIKEKWAFIGLMVIASCIFVVAPTINAGPIEDAAQLTRQWVKAFHDGNAEALSALHSKDGVYISWAGPFPAEGREAIRGAYTGFFQAFPTRYLVLRDESRKAYGDTVVFDCNWTLIYGDGKGPVKTVYGRTTSITAIVEGRRLIVDQHTSLLPIVGP